MMNMGIQLRTQLLSSSRQHRDKLLQRRRHDSSIMVSLSSLPTHSAPPHARRSSSISSRRQVMFLPVNLRKHQSVLKRTRMVISTCISVPGTLSPSSSTMQRTLTSRVSPVKATLGPTRTHTTPTSGALALYARTKR